MYNVRVDVFKVKISAYCNRNYYHITLKTFHTRFITDTMVHTVAIRYTAHWMLQWHNPKIAYLELYYNRAKKYINYLQQWRHLAEYVSTNKCAGIVGCLGWSFFNSINKLLRSWAQS